MDTTRSDPMNTKLIKPPKNCQRCGTHLHSQLQEIHSRTTGRKLAMRTCPQRLSSETTNVEAVLHDEAREQQDGSWVVSYG